MFGAGGNTASTGVGTAGTGLFGQPPAAQGTGTMTGGGFFGNTNPSTTTGTGAGLFGQQPAAGAGTMGAGTGTGLFGNLGQTNVAGAGTTGGTTTGMTNLFGQPSNQGTTTGATTGGGLFGAGTGTATTGGGLFGNQQYAQPGAGTTTGTGLFGQPAAQGTATTGATGGMFGNLGGTTTQAHPAASGGLFGNLGATTANTGMGTGGPFGGGSTLFGGARPPGTMGGTLFGGNSLLGQPPQQLQQLQQPAAHAHLTVVTNLAQKLMYLQQAMAGNAESLATVNLLGQLVTSLVTEKFQVGLRSSERDQPIDYYT